MNSTPSAGRILRYTEHLEERGLLDATISQYREVLERLDRAIGLEEITPRDVRAYCEARDLSGWTRLVYWRTVRAFVLWTALPEPGSEPAESSARDHAGTRQRLAEVWAAARRPHEPGPRPRPVTDHDLGVLLERLDDPYRSWAILAAYAGMRRAEVARVRGDALTRGPYGPEVRIEVGKGGHSASLPAHPLVIGVLEDAPRGRVWQYTPQRLGLLASTEFRRVGVPATMHQLRSTFATRLYRATGDVRTVQQALRHSSLVTTIRYIGADQDRLAAGISRLTIPS